MVVLLPRLGAIGCAVLGGTTVAAVIVFGWWAFRELGWLIDPTYPSGGALTVFTTGILLSFRRSDVERKRVRDMFSHYLAPAMVKRLVANPNLVRLGGEVRDLTIMFCDIRDFTTISERMEASALTSLLNDFLTPMSEAVMYNEGTIDKYIGDSIMAFWGAPLDQEDRADRAVRTAQRIAQKLHIDNARRARKGLKPIRIRIGIHKGPALVGNIGAPGRVNYTLVGDTVNVAQRLEQFGREVDDGVSDAVIVISGELASALPPGAALIDHGDQLFHGRSTPTRVFRVPMV